MYSARKVPRLLSTSSLFLHLPCGQPFSPKDCRSRPFRNSVMIFNQNARQNIPEDYYIQQWVNIHGHGCCSMCCSTNCKIRALHHTSSWHGTYVTINVIFIVRTKPRDWTVGFRIPDEYRYRDWRSKGFLMLTTRYAENCWYIALKYTTRNFHRRNLCK